MSLALAGGLLTTVPPGKPSFRSFKKFIYFILFYLCMYVCMAALGIPCCAQAFSSCGEGGLLFVAVRGLLTVVASLVAKHRL